MNLEHLEGNVLRSIRQNMGIEPEDQSLDSEIAQMGPDELFERFLTWNGIIDYGEMISQAVVDIHKACAPDGIPFENAPAGWPFDY